jgi:urease accessory protein
MSEPMQIIHEHLAAWREALPHIPLSVDRLTLAKRRWRAKASDGTEFGFDLDHPLADGDHFFQSETAVYRIAQQPEPVLEVFLFSPLDAAQTGWKIGNLHFPIAVLAHTVLAPDDPAIRQMLEREHITFRAIEAVFQPLQGSHSHGTHSH